MLFCHEHGAILTDVLKPLRGKFRCPVDNTFLSRDPPLAEDGDDDESGPDLAKIASRSARKAIESVSATTAGQVVRSLMGNGSQPDVRDAEISRLKDELAKRDRESLEARLSAVEQRVSKENGGNGKSPELDLFGKIVGELARRALEPPPPAPDPFAIASRAIETVRSYSSMLEPSSQNLEVAKLNAKLKVWEVEHGDRLAQMQAQAQAAAQEAAEGRAQFRELVEVGKVTVEKALSPLLNTFEAAVHDRIAGGPRGATAAPPKQVLDYSRMGPEERAAYLQKVEEIEAKVALEKSRILAAGQENATGLAPSPAPLPGAERPQPPTPSPEPVLEEPAPPAMRGYGEIVQGVGGSAS